LRIYLDSAPVIYAIQSVEPFFPSVSQWIGRPDAVLVVSDLTRLECRVPPIRDGNSLLLEAYDEFFSTGVKEIVPLPPPALPVILPTGIGCKVSHRTRGASWVSKHSELLQSFCFS